LIGNETHPF
jgi:hypothetical protein